MRPRILTWHVHGNYLWYLSQVGCDLYLPVREGRPEGYGGRTASFPWPDTVHEIDAETVRELEFDAVLFQSQRNWEIDQHEICSDAQRRGPRVFLEHDPPRVHPTDTRHPVQDPDVLLVHVTHFNELFWDNGVTPTRVVEHGVVVPDTAIWTGELARALTVVNCIGRRGRRLGADVYERVAARHPVDLVGMESVDAGGLGEIPPAQLPGFMARYRAFFNPIRYTSLGLAVCEAMTIGLPIIGLATTEMAAVVENGVNGWVGTDLDEVEGHLRDVLLDHDQAAALSRGARRIGAERFGIDRFRRDWLEVFATVGAGPATVPGAPEPRPDGATVSALR